MSVTLSPPMFLQFFSPNNSGAPAAGYLLFTYIAGTSTKQATWTDSTQTVQNSNPIVLDSNGAAYVWGDPTLSYKFVFCQPNDTDPPTSPLRTVDNIQFPVSLSTITEQFIGLLLYPLTSAEIAAGVTPVNYSYPPGNIYRYGTNSSPGSTDMTAAIQDAINQSAQAGGSPAYVPQNLHRTTATLMLRRYATLYGDGYFSQILYGGADVAIRAVGAAKPEVWRRATVRGLNVSTSTGTHGIIIQDIAEFEISENIFDGFSVAGIKLTGESGSACINIWVLSNICINGGHGLLADGVNNVNQIAIHHNQFEGNGGAGIFFAVAGKGISIVGNDIEGNGVSGLAELYMNGGNMSGVSISGNYFETVVNHPCILIADTVDAWGISITGNILQADTAIADAILLGNAGGAVYGVSVEGNSFSGSMTNGINAKFVVGGRFGPNFATAIVHLVVGVASASIDELGVEGPVTRVGGRTGATHTLPYSVSIATDASLAELFAIAVTDNASFTITKPINLLPGMFLTYEIINSAGAPMGTITWTGFKLSGAFTNPAANNVRFITYYYDGSSVREINRTAADQPV